MKKGSQSEIFKQDSTVGEGWLEEEGRAQSYRPLAARMRPRSLSEVVGQRHILGEKCLLPRLIRSGQIGSILLYGPPGCGKTTLAEVIAREVGSRFLRINAVSSNVAELRDVLRWARNRPEDRTIVFIDEIHRFNKAQQDLLLPDVEAGVIRLIGATTHNPGHYIIAPLLSRSHLFRLEPLEVEVILSVLQKTLKDPERGLGGHNVTVDEDALRLLAKVSDGDLRRALGALETIVISIPLGGHLSLSEVEIFAKERQIRYDANEDEHYDTISAFIKSIRGSDPDAALYWLAKMLIGGEDPRFITRRLVVLASEDVGLADSRGLQVAVAAAQAVEMVGLPEAEYALAHATLFLALAPKSNSTGLSLLKAKKALKSGRIQSVPMHLRNKFNKSLGHGQNYAYSHDYPQGISGQDYMEEPMSFYTPKKLGAEAAMAERLSYWRQLKADIRKKRGTDLSEK